MATNDCNNKIQHQLALASVDCEDLLYAAEGLKELGSVLMYMADSDNEISAGSIGYLVHAMGRHVQNTRNKVAEHLKSTYESFGVDPITY